MSEIIEMINAKRKAISVIESCETDKHLACAKNYIDLFKDRFDDFTTYNDLKLRLRNKKDELYARKD